MKYRTRDTLCALMLPAICLGGILAMVWFGARPVAAAGQEQAPPPSGQSELLEQSQADADRKSSGCISCHTSTDSATMHQTGTVRLGCVDCHGGDAKVAASPSSKPGTRDYDEAKLKAHPRPRFAEDGRTSANPTRAYTSWLKEDPQYIQFVNPGDLRIAERTCGSSGCHTSEVMRVRTSMMTHGAMLWGAALYNNEIGRAS